MRHRTLLSKSSLPLLPFFEKKERPKKGDFCFLFPLFPPVLPSLLTFSGNPVTPSLITPFFFSSS